MSDLLPQGKIMIFIEKFPYFKCGNLSNLLFFGEKNAHFIKNII